MGKFAEMISLLELEIGTKPNTLKVVLIPEAEDYLRFGRILTGVKKNDDEIKMYEQCNAFLNELMLRPTSRIDVKIDKATKIETFTKPNEIDDEDKNELKRLIAQNQVQIQKDLMIACKWTTQEKLDKIENNFKDKDSKN